jgi:hypothetical protein
MLKLGFLALFAVAVSANVLRTSTPLTKNLMNQLKMDPDMPAFLRNNFTEENVLRYFTFHLEERPTFPNNTEPERLGIDPATIIMIGTQIWKIVEGGKPTSSINVAYGGAIPAGAAWNQMAGWRDNVWSQPGNWHFHYDWTNIMGTHVSVDWKWTWQCSGNYQGIGKYVNIGAPIPSNIRVGWGYNLDISVAPQQNPVNYGSTAQPIAGLQFVLTLKITNPLNTETVQHRAVLKGDCGAVCNP